MGRGSALPVIADLRNFFLVSRNLSSEKILGDHYKNDIETV
jgi:hypothetical protein